MADPDSKPCSQKLKQFNGSQIRILGKFETSVESESRIDVIDVIVADCIKSHDLIGMDIIQVNAAAMIHSVKTEEVGRLKGYKANILLRSDTRPTYFESQPLRFKYRGISHCCINLS